MQVRDAPLRPAPGGHERSSSNPAIVIEVERDDGHVMGDAVEEKGMDKHVETQRRAEPAAGFAHLVVKRKERCEPELRSAPFLPFALRLRSGRPERRRGA